MNQYNLQKIIGLLFLFLSYASVLQSQDSLPLGANPIIRNVYTADPAAMVWQDTVFLYTGHDEAPDGVERYIMHDWLCFSSTDMVHWKSYPVPLRVKDFSWAKDDAWASQVIYRDGHFYWYAAVRHNNLPGMAIGVAVSNRPEGPYHDARGTALITNNMTRNTSISWDDIDPTLFIDYDGQAYMIWGNTVCYMAKLKRNMTELDGPITTISLPHYTEAPWIHKHGAYYYLSYAYGFPEKTAYAMSRSINGPWHFMGVLNELAGNSNTNHHAIIDFKGKSYFIYHNGALSSNGSSYHRSVCIDRLYYNKDGSMKRVVMTSEGLSDSLK